MKVIPVMIDSVQDNSGDCMKISFKVKLVKILKGNTQHFNTLNLDKCWKRKNVLKGTQ